MTELMGKVAKRVYWSLSALFQSHGAQRVEIQAELRRWEMLTGSPGKKIKTAEQEGNEMTAAQVSSGCRAGTCKASF